MCTHAGLIDFRMEREREGKREKDRKKEGPPLVKTVLINRVDARESVLGPLYIAYPLSNDHVNVNPRQVQRRHNGAIYKK